ncbi:MAG: hypothetical protein KJO46_06565 [Gammaproteobacteria bacterium]|nr:hypothetical protein [Gammaproteobacteria bacterium]
MDKLANRLRQDAERIEVTVSDELDDRITASLRGVTPREDEGTRVERTRPAGFWWASSLTGIAAAAAVILIINAQQSEPPPARATPTNILAAVPVVDLQAEAAMMTGQLQDELNNLRSDIKKAEQQVREDIGL